MRVDIPFPKQTRTIFLYRLITDCFHFGENLRIKKKISTLLSKIILVSYVNRLTSQILPFFVLLHFVSFPSKETFNDLLKSLFNINLLFYGRIIFLKYLYNQVH